MPGERHTEANRDPEHEVHRGFPEQGIAHSVEEIGQSAGKRCERKPARWLAVLPDQPPEGKHWIPEIEHATSRPLDRVSFTPGGTLNLFANPTKFPLVRSAAKRNGGNHV